eukprot:TRINITY_DN1651_c0_g1_i1.p1 TRINITY_DN1651_c0_g1~~TRINITY_DN1651_c0_g1_i1.p1  ORF type:complete len:232 (+),score=49.17 TRINITY_DN1651_c0_g1_i1:40-696(+)
MTTPKSTIQSLTVTPDPLNFPPPFDKVVKKTLQLENKTDLITVWKVKTTAPKRYIVRPNVGFVLGKETKEIQVKFNLSKDPPENNEDLKKDKFLILYFTYKEKIPQDEEERNKLLTQLWKEEPPRPTNKIRLSCTFLEENVARKEQTDQPKEPERSTDKVTEVNPSDTQTVKTERSNVNQQKDQQLIQAIAPYIQERTLLLLLLGFVVGKILIYLFSK